MKNKGFFKILVLVATLLISYYLYKQIIILKSEYIKREQKKEIFLEEIDKTYKERESEFYKVN
ncbi:MAG: hypothetical protein ACRCVB_05970 [Cetobacterium sp.]|uniref:hypothetical protein n=1 Tax=unclassified Cetobacterium TaxID=2630983 RepID=UPI000647A7AB|nr:MULTISPECIES: hypothetical protein [unclassified Cetobacterium]